MSNFLLGVVAALAGSHALVLVLLVLAVRNPRLPSPGKTDAGPQIELPPQKDARAERKLLRRQRA